jgi:hypothetical protein
MTRACLWFAVVALASGGCSKDDGVGTVAGQVFDALTAEPVAGATVKVQSRDQMREGITDAEGKFEIGDVPESASAVVTVELTAHAKGVEVTAVPKGGEGFVEAFVLPVGAVGQIDAEAGGTLKGSAGASLKIEEGSLVHADGTAATGTVDVEITAIDPRGALASRAVPGQHIVRTFAGTEAIAEIKAPMTLTIRKGGEELNLAAGKFAELEIPAFDPTGPAQMTLYGLDESTGKWVAEASVVKAQTVDGPVYKATVPHFSTWAGGRVVTGTCVRACVTDGRRAVRGAQVTLVGVDFDTRTTASTDSDGCFAANTKAGGQVRLTAATRTAMGRLYFTAGTTPMRMEDDAEACQDLGTVTVQEQVDRDPTCPAGFTRCGDRCVDLDADPSNCGTCGTDCSQHGEVSYSHCIEGTCACPASYDVCDGRCTDVRSEPHHCSGCDLWCTEGQECVDSTCRLPDVDGTPDAGVDPTDAGTGMDAGTITDAGASWDAGTPYDGGTWWDAGGGDPGTGDAGTSWDSGWEPDPEPDASVWSDGAVAG